MDAHEPERPERSPSADDAGSEAWPTVELDLTGRESPPTGGGTVGDGHGHGLHGHGRRGPRRRVLVATSLIAVVAVAGIVALATGTPDAIRGGTDADSTPSTIERDPPATGSAAESDDAPAVGTVDPVEAHEVATLAIGDQVSGSSRALALLDADGLRIADLDAGTITESTAIGPVGAPVLAGPGRAFVFVSGNELREVDAQGRQRTIGVAHGTAVGLDRQLVWMLGREGDRNVLTAVGRSSGAVVEQITLAGSATLVGFHAGRPLVATGDLVIRYDPAGATVVVTTGQVVATGGEQLLVRRCAEPGCDEAIVVDLHDRGERTVRLAAEVRAFGLGDALSPDGRWLVGLVFRERSRPELAVHPLVGPDEVRPDPLVLSVGVLGFGGRAAGVTWSPDAALLAAPGSSRVALVDVARRSTVTIPIRLSGSGPTVRWLAS